jgi:nitrogenase subunit NifH
MAKLWNPKMDSNAQDFVTAFHRAVGQAMRAKVPLDFMVSAIEITKVDLANQFIEQQVGKRAKNLAQKIADATPQIDGQNKN